MLAARRGRGLRAGLRLGVTEESSAWSASGVVDGNRADSDRSTTSRDTGGTIKPSMLKLPRPMVFWTAFEL